MLECLFCQYDATSRILVIGMVRTDVEGKTGDILTQSQSVSPVGSCWGYSSGTRHHCQVSAPYVKIGHP